MDFSLKYKYCNELKVGKVEIEQFWLYIPLLCDVRKVVLILNWKLFLKLRKFLKSSPQEDKAK